MTEPDADEPPVVEDAALDEPTPVDATRRRLRILPALAVAAMLVAGGLLMAVGGMARIMEPAPPTRVPTLAPPSVTPLPTKLPVTPTLDPSASPIG